MGQPQICKNERFIGSSRKAAAIAAALRRAGKRRNDAGWKVRSAGKGDETDLHLRLQRRRRVDRCLQRTDTRRRRQSLVLCGRLADLICAPQVDQQVGQGVMMPASVTTGASMA